MRNLSRKIKFGKIRKTRASPRWADIKKFGLKKARKRRINVTIKRWRRSRLRV